MTKKSIAKRIVKTTVVLLLILALAGTAFLALFREKIDKWEYPIQYSEYVTYYADKYDIDPLMLYAFIRTESNFNPQAESNVGAQIPMQAPAD